MAGPGFVKMDVAKALWVNREASCPLGPRSGESESRTM